MPEDLRKDLGNAQAHVHMCQAEQDGRARHTEEYWARYAGRGPRKDKQALPSASGMRLWKHTLMAGDHQSPATVYVPCCYFP